ncbi:enoyl-CoA hydratase [Frondihabitans sp. PAMC 28766]|uniref:enoyl-CoA hydratase/isomerase family protein n=1 Tax=Frondihabitans sp. PAMC 28766 TaxID=1795630 RepID=UPI00078E09FF|nr:enoyl-CoA hydratase-related protein [Frondihabitans sp. PAMC 28766]AMM21852.1 enoyl-CoA hydratase [Frondihabitans sp. PAMC 28766]
MTDIKKTVVTWETLPGGIVRVDLGRAPANALGIPLIEGIEQAFDSADAHGDVKVILFASTVPGFFAAGADIKLMASVDVRGFEEYGDALRHMIERVAASTRITVAAVEGLALGGGLELAAACTLRVAGADAEFGVPEVKLGLIPGAAGTQRLPRLVGRGHALDMILTGRQIKAPEALTMGLVDRLVPAGQARMEALALASQLRESSYPALLAALRSVDASDTLPLADGIALERHEIRDLFESGEGREGIAAFVQKRRPEFS